MNPSNTPLTFDEANNRLLEFGRRIVSAHPSGTVTSSTTVTVACSLGHKRTGIYSHFRQRTCGECEASFGERLLFLLLRFYVGGEDDWQSKKIEGLDPKDRSRKLEFDALSFSRMVAIECQSEYHRKGASNRLFDKGMLNGERVRLDKLKCPAPDGCHRSGPLKGWKVATVWFEAARVRTLIDSTGSYLPTVVKEFKSVAQDLGLELRCDGVELTAYEVFLGLAQHYSSAVSKEFELLDEWTTRSPRYRWRHACGAEFRSTIGKLEDRVFKEGGCPYCHRHGRLGQMREFEERLERHGYEILPEYRRRLITEYEHVPVRCKKHLGITCAVWRRSDWYQWLHLEEKDFPLKRLPPPCPVCADSHSRSVNRRQEKSIITRRFDLDQKLRVYGFEMVTFRPSTYDESDKKSSTKNTIRCLNCSHRQDVYVPQRLSKAKKIGAMGCPNCRPLKKGPKPKVENR